MDCFKIPPRGVVTEEDDIKFMLFLNAFGTNPNDSEGLVGHVTASIDTPYTILDDGATTTLKKKMVDFTGNTLELTGSNTFNPGDVIKIGVSSNNTGQDRVFTNASMTFVFKLNEVAPVSY